MKGNLGLQEGQEVGNRKLEGANSALYLRTLELCSGSLSFRTFITCTVYKQDRVQDTLTFLVQGRSATVDRLVLGVW